MKGISVKRAKGVGDLVQFSSVPENYFVATGEKLVDVDRSWIFDSNPYVVRDVPARSIVDLWNWSPMQYEWPVPEATQGDGRVPAVYQSNAEIWSRVMGVTKPTLIRPRLYRYEDCVPFERRRKILLHADGHSHGTLPYHVVCHLIDKYEPTGELFIIGKPRDAYGLRYIPTETLWDLARLIAEARMLVGCDSGPSWIAACYPDVIVKKVRTRPSVDRYDTWTPLAVKNVHAHWDDRIFQIFNPGETDLGPFQSYKRM